MKTSVSSMALALITFALSAITTGAFAQCSISIVVTNPKCAGACNGSAIVNVTNGTAPYVYLWSPSGQTTQTATGLCPGNYTCLVTDANLSTCSDSFDITSPMPLAAGFVTDSASCYGCCDGAVHAIASPINLSPFQFKLTATPYQYSGDFYSVCAGYDTLCVQDVFGCISCFPIIINPLATGINEIQNGFLINTTPNPFSAQLTFSLAGNEQTTVSLYNFLGQQVLQQTFANSTTINTERLADGIYFYELRNNKGTLKTGKVVKQ